MTVNELRDEMKDGFAEVRGEISALRTEMHDGFAEIRRELRTEMNDGFKAVRGEMDGFRIELDGFRAELVGLRAEMNERFARVDDQFKLVDARFKRVDERFDEQRTYMKVMFEQVRDDIRLLAEAITSHSSRIAHLEAANESTQERLGLHDVRLRHLERRKPTRH